MAKNRGEKKNPEIRLGPDETVLAEPEISPLCLWPETGMLLASVAVLCLCANLSFLSGLFSLFGFGEIFSEMTEYFQTEIIDVFNAALGTSLSGNPYVPGALIWMLFQCFKLLFGAVSWEMRRVYLTNIRLVYRTGVFVRKTCEIRCAQVESVSVGENLLERISNSGTLEVRGTGTGEIRIPFLKDALRFREILHDAVARARRAA